VQAGSTDDPSLPRRPEPTPSAGPYPEAAQAAPREECESGRIGTIGNRVTCKGPRVRIPPPPLAQGQRQNWPIRSDRTRCEVVESMPALCIKSERALIGGCAGT
jgi:hypothetical protein